MISKLEGQYYAFEHNHKRMTKNIYSILKNIPCMENRIRWFAWIIVKNLALIKTLPIDDTKQ